MSEAASLHLNLTVQFDAMPLLPNQLNAEVRPDPESPSTEGQELAVSPSLAAAALRLPAVPIREAPPAPVEPELSPYQREHTDKLEVYEAPRNLPVITFAKLAGKSRDQVNRDIKAGRLLTLALGNRGQRAPDWRPDGVRHKLTQALLKQAADAMGERAIYRALSQPHSELGGRPPIDVVTQTSVDRISALLCGAWAEG